MTRSVVYTCITGGYDPIRPPERVDPSLDYLCFTDADHCPAPWRRLTIPVHGLDALDQNRYVKMHPHRIEALAKYDLSMYVDGSIAIIGDPLDLIRQVETRDEQIFAYEHPDRNCLFDEGLACALGGLGWIWQIDRQLARYRAEGFPARLGLFEASVLVRRRSPELERFMERWWAEYRTGVKRDQLSFTYVAWKEGVRIGSLGRSDPRFLHRIFRLEPHTDRPGIGPPLRRRINRLLARTNLYSTLTGPREI